MTAIRFSVMLSPSYSGVPWFRRGVLTFSGRVQVDHQGPGKKGIKN